MDREWGSGWVERGNRSLRGFIKNNNNITIKKMTLIKYYNKKIIIMNIKKNKIKIKLKKKNK